MKDVTIEQISNGYVVITIARRWYAPTFEEICSYLLQLFEGRADTFTGDLYGTVQIVRGTPPPTQENTR